MINLCFHGVGVPRRELEPGEGPYWISADFFTNVLDVVAAAPQVRLSFDDGNASDVEIALPALTGRGLTASFFPVADRIGQVGSVDPEGLRRLRDTGMTIGSHGMRHRPWRGMSDEQLSEELVDARRIIAEASGADSAEVAEAACPLGRYDRRVLARLRRLGYHRVFTSDRARARRSAWLQPRYSLRRADDLASVRSLLSDPPVLRDRIVGSARITAKRWR